MPHYWLFLALPPLLAAAVADIGWRIIPNWVPLALVLGYAVAMIIERDPTGLVQALAIGAGVLIAGIVPFAAGLIGGGDVKLAAAVAVWIGAGALPEFLVVMALVGGLLALVTLALRIVRRLLDHGRRPAGPPSGVPYGVAIVAAAVWILAGRP
ncbi:A24 family peptidase [Benzoatithermus flavus]|uniref:Prepilin peptidase n=1 Tax=Benzoatithermus flavus TaxID=3108223 RepID=A0ABU8XPK3_9PROT